MKRVSGDIFNKFKNLILPVQSASAVFTLDGRCSFFLIGWFAFLSILMLNNWQIKVYQYASGRNMLQCTCIICINESIEIDPTNNCCHVSKNVDYFFSSLQLVLLLIYCQFDLVTFALGHVHDFDWPFHEQLC